MKEKPILFSGPMVRVILEGKKTQTRRVVKPQPVYRCDVDDPTGITCNGWWWTKPNGTGIHSQVSEAALKSTFERSLYWCPYGKPDDRLWVRETWASDDGRTAFYRADGETYNYGLPWKPSIHMPRWASRITLEICSVRVERLQEISGEDLKAEGISGLLCYGPACGPACTQERRCEGRKEAFIDLWNSLNAARGFGWETNPYVWVLEFRRLQP